MTGTRFHSLPRDVLLVNFAGKRVIDIGPASGFLSFHMERAGAQVVCIATSAWTMGAASMLSMRRPAPDSPIPSTTR